VFCEAGHLAGELSSNLSLLMPSLVPGKALASLVPTAPSTTTTSSTATASSTKTMAPSRTPDVPRDALAPTHWLVKKLLQLNESPSEVPLEVLAKEFCFATNVTYGKFDVLLNRQFTIPSEKWVNNKNNPTVDTSQGVHEHRFCFWIAKGATQFTKLFSKHHEFDAKDTMKTFLNGFYLTMFPGEEKELDKLLTDKDMRHLVLNG
jgi:hypothetical protein